MSHASDLIATDINAYLRQHERKELLRFLTCGSVDDGKSTLIGRLLYDAKMIYEDQLAAIRRDTSRHGTTGTDFDPALLTDGLKAEREQGITIDVAYRYFSTAKRKFIIADTPGHEQYTRNMVTGASNCDLAIILIDARKGLLVQTRRHSFIAALLGIRHVVVAVNKMDLVEYREEVFAQIQSDYAGLAAKLDLRDVTFIPVAALHGDNIVDPSANMPWYRGSTLMYHLENVHIASDRNLIDLRLPVQLVNRPNADFRGFCGTVASGVVRVGDEIMALPSRRTSRVKSIVTFDGELTEAIAPLAITLTLADEVDISRGDMLVRPGNLPRVGTSFDAMVVWMSPTPLVSGRQYLIKHATRSTFGAVSSLRYQIDVNTLHRRPAATLALNEIGRCEVTVERPLAFDAYVRNRATGAFIVIDRLSNETVGAGLILEHDGAGTKRSHWDTPPVSGTLETGASQVTPSEREARFGQKPATVLFTGPSGSGKTTLARAVERRLFDLGRACAVLDGAALRQSISRDLGFSPAERSENLRRGAELARLMNEAGLICLAAFVAPQESARRRAAELVGTDRFLVVELTALPVDQNTGHSSSATTIRPTPAVMHGEEVTYEPPVAPDLTVDLRQNDVAEEVERVLALLRMRDFIR